MTPRCFLLLLFLAVPLFAQQRLLPADPLTAAEIERANRAATETAAKHFGGDARLELVNTNLANLKPPTTGERQPDLAPADVTRHAIVTFYDYGRDEGLSVLVNLGAAAVVDTAPVPSQSVGLAPREVARAVELALQNEDVRRRVRAEGTTFRPRARRTGPGEDAVDAIRVRGTSPDDPCSRDRCVELFFQRGGRYIVGQRIVVNLTRGTVRAETTPAGARR